MAYVIAYDMLFGEMRKPNGIARLMTKHSEPLKMALQKYMVEMGVKDKAQLKTKITSKTSLPLLLVECNLGHLELDPTRF